jgi:hypothetical protein
VYDYNNRYVMVVSEYNIYIGNLHNPKEPWINYKLNKELYEGILDASMISHKNGQFELLIACKVQNLNQIHLFDAISYTKGG